MGTIGALRQRGQINVVRIGRNHHYYVNMDAPFLHPTISGLKIGDLLSGLARRSAAVGWFCRNHLCVVGDGTIDAPLPVQAGA